MQGKTRCKESSLNEQHQQLHVAAGLQRTPRRRSLQQLGAWASVDALVNVLSSCVPAARCTSCVRYHCCVLDHGCLLQASVISLIADRQGNPCRLLAVVQMLCGGVIVRTWWLQHGCCCATCKKRLFVGPCCAADAGLSWLLQCVLDAVQPAVSSCSLARSLWPTQVLRARCCWFARCCMQTLAYTMTVQTWSMLAHCHGIIVIGVR